MLIKAGERKLALKIIKKIHNIEEVVELLLAMKESKAAVDFAIEKKDKKILNELLQTLNDPNLKSYIEDFLAATK